MMPLLHKTTLPRPMLSQLLHRPKNLLTRCTPTGLSLNELRDIHARHKDQVSVLWLRTHAAITSMTMYAFGILRCPRQNVETTDQHLYWRFLKLYPYCEWTIPASSRFVTSYMTWTFPVIVATSFYQSSIYRCQSLTVFATFTSDAMLPQHYRCTRFIFCSRPPLSTFTYNYKKKEKRFDSNPRHVHKQKETVYSRGLLIGQVYSFMTLHHPLTTFIFISPITFVIISLAILRVI
jgi:hypothetical protein